MKPSLLLAIATAATLAAQVPCADNERQGNRDRANHCEIREYTLNDTGRLIVDASKNGGIRVTGADRTNVLVRARVNASAPSMDEAKALATQVAVQATPGNVHSSGPEDLRDRGWAVSYEIQVPRRSGLNLKAYNGGIGISDVEGDITFDALNGGVTLNRLGGDVRGKTVNGGLRVELAGNTWRGNQLDVQTTNGVTLLTPTVFRTDMALPAETSIGNYDVDVRVFADRQVVARTGSAFEIIKVGFEQFVANAAREYGFIYGLAAAMMAIVTGWFASVVFRRD